MGGARNRHPFQISPEAEAKGRQDDAWPPWAPLGLQSKRDKGILRLGPACPSLHDDAHREGLATMETRKPPCGTGTGLQPASPTAHTPRPGETREVRSRPQRGQHRLLKAPGVGPGVAPGVGPGETATCVAMLSGPVLSSRCEERAAFLPPGLCWPPSLPPWPQNVLGVFLQQSGGISLSPADR